MNCLLLNILPAEVASELKETGHTKPMQFEEVSILFAGFKQFTNIVASQSPMVIEMFTTSDKTLVVKNNIQRKNVQETSTQLGIKNIIKRYEFLTDKKVKVIDNSNFFIVKLPVLNKKEKRKYLS